MFDMFGVVDNDKTGYEVSFNFDKALADSKYNKRESDTEYILDLEMPGVDKDDIEIYVENDYLVIKASREIIKKDEEYEYIVAGLLNYDCLERKIYLEDIDVENIKAKYKNGILTITVPKKIDAVKRTLIEVE